jgi:hypothetical protein
MGLENNLDFLREGLNSYMNAMLALKQFQLEVQKKSKKVLEQNLKDLGQALGTRLEATAIQPYVNPSHPSKFDGTYAWITSRLCNVPRLDSAESAHFGLRWREIDGEAVLGVAAGFWFRTASDGNAAKNAFGRGGDGLIYDPFGWYFWDALPPEDAKSFEAKLDGLIKKWVELWREVGGLNGVVKLESTD